MKTKKATESPPPQPTPVADGASPDAETGQSTQYRPEQSHQDNTAAPASRRTGRPVRGSSLGYAAAHLGSASVASLGAIGSAYGLGGVAVAGGLLAAGAATAYGATRMTRAGARRAAGDTRTASRTLAGGARARQPGGRARGLLGRGRRGPELTGRRAATDRAVGGARPATRKGLLNSTNGGRRGPLGARLPVTSGALSTWRQR